MSAALDLIKDVGVATLGGFDGCLCTHFSVQGVSVDVGCRKSSNRATVRVYSNQEIPRSYLEEIAEEIAKHLGKIESTPMSFRYCSYQDDNPPRCIYCHAPRAQAHGRNAHPRKRCTKSPSSLSAARGQ